MALLERIESMKQAGMSDSQIVNTLKEEGVSPREISEGLSQSKIKMAVSQEESPENFNGMQASIMPAQQPEIQTSNPEMSVPDYPAPQIPDYPPQQIPQQYYPPEQIQQPQEQYYPPEAYANPETAAYPPEAYAGQDQGGYYSQVLDIETVRDIAKQEIEEGLKKIREQISSTEKMKSEIKFEVQNMENRIARIESIIQEIQSSIIKKMGQYGEAISGISSEIKATQQSFSKMLNPLMDKRKMSESEESYEEAPEKIEPKAKPKKSESRNSAKGASFEDYLR